MDDVLTGADTIAEAIALQLTDLLEKGQFHLRKWRSNDEKILNHLLEESKSEDSLILNKEALLKTLSVVESQRRSAVKHEEYQ